MEFEQVTVSVPEVPAWLWITLGVLVHLACGILAARRAYRHYRFHTDGDEVAVPFVCLLGGPFSFVIWVLAKGMAKAVTWRNE